MNKKLLFVVDNLVMGGVTRVLVNLLKNLDYSKYDVDLLVLHYGDDIAACVPPQVNVLKGDSTYQYIDRSIGTIIKDRDVKAFLGKLKLVVSLKSGIIKKVIRKSRAKLLQKVYDTEISFNDGFTQIFVAEGDSKKKVSWLHADISVFNNSARHVGLIGECLKKMDAFVCVSSQVKHAYEQQFGIQNATVIHNIMDAAKILADAQVPVASPFPQDCIRLISVGRLCDAKNYGRLIRVHQKLKESGYNIHTCIVGDGPDRDSLQQLIESYGIHDSFTLLGRKENPFPYVKHADLFVLSSNHEGLPTVLFESLILGIPCVTTRVAGTEEILGDQYGIITEKSDEALFEGIKAMLAENTFEAYRQAAQSYKYSIHSIIAQIEEIL